MDRPKRRATIIEKHERIQFVCDMLARGNQKSVIKSAFRVKYGAIGAKQLEWYLTQAKKELRESIGVPPDDLRGASFAVYCSVLQNPNATPREKILAQERIDRLLGLELQVSKVKVEQQTNLTLQEVMDHMDSLEGKIVGLLDDVPPSQDPA